MMEFEKQAQVFKALGDPKRLQILEYLKNGEKCACELMILMDLKQSALAYHMKILTEAGLVHSRPDGKWIRYTIDHSSCRKTSASLLDVTGSRNNKECLF